MPKINSLPQDTTISNSDFLIGGDGNASGASKRFPLENLKAFLNTSELDGYSDGRLLLPNEEKFVESFLDQFYTIQTYDGSAGTGENDSILATSATNINIGQQIGDAFFAMNPAAGDIIVITNNETNDRGFGVIATASADNNTLTLATGKTLVNYTDFISTKGYENSLTLIKGSKFVSEIDFEVEGKIVVHNGIEDENGNSLVGANLATITGNNAFTGNNSFAGTSTLNGATTVASGANLTVNSTNFQATNGLTIGGTSATQFIIDEPSSAPSNNQVLKYNTSNKTLTFDSVDDLITFGSGGVATWAEHGYTGDDNIPTSVLPIATSSAIGAVKPGTNLAVANDGTLNASGTVGTINIQNGGTDVGQNASTINFAGTAVASASANGATTTVTINAGSVTFGSADGNVATWAEGDDTSDIPSGKLGLAALKASANTFAAVNTHEAKDVFEAGLTIGDSTTYDLPVLSSAPSQNQGLVFNSSGNLVVGNPALEDVENTFTNTQNIRNAAGGTINLRRVTESPANNNDIFNINGEAYSAETSSYQEFVSIDSKFRSDSTYEYGQLDINTNFVTKSNDTFSSLNAISVNRTGATFNVPATFTGNVTVGNAASDTLTVEATATFDENVDAAVTRAVNQRDTTNSMKFWHGTQAQYNAIATKDANTIYFTT